MISIPLPALPNRSARISLLSLKRFGATVRLSSPAARVRTTTTALTGSPAPSPISAGNVFLIASTHSAEDAGSVMPSAMTSSGLTATSFPNLPMSATDVDASLSVR